MRKKPSEIKRLLVVIDLVNGFVREGTMADKYIEHIIPECEKLVKEFLKRGDEVAYVQDYHKINCTEFERFPTHCVEGTSESEMVEELQKYIPEVFVFVKNSTSAMAAEYGLRILLNSLKSLEEVVIVGCCTDICVLNCAIPMQNYFDELDRKVTVVVPKNAVETYELPDHSREEYNEIAFKLLAQAGVKVVNNY